MKKLFLAPVTGILLLVGLMASLQVTAQNPRFGNGYENLTRRTTGGKVRNGDILDIKMAVHLPWGYNGGASGKIYNVRFVDNIPTNTVMLSSATDSIRVLTNEDLTFKKYTVAAGDDAASYVASPAAGEFNIRINLGASPNKPTNNNPTDLTGTSTINLTNSYPYGDQPKWWTGHIFSTSYRVRVTGAAGDTIRLFGGRFYYKRASGGVDSINVGFPYQIVIGTDDSLCQSGRGKNYAGEFGGTFGRGNTLNRVGGPSSLVPGYTYVSNVSGSAGVDINDGSYGIVNNISPWSSTNRNARRLPNCTTPTPIPAADSCKFRMFNGNWEIEGDHTGTTSLWGNNPPASGTTSGYMLVVNADYITSNAYQQTINNLCENTYYEFSCYLRNICRTCGGDANLTGTNQPGVRPTLTFAIDGLDRYSTGELDTTGWIKKSFLFKTGMGQTSAVFSIRNNAQGGGGNDWALDDINISSCVPTSKFNYQPLVGCNSGTLVSLSDTIRYRYNDTYQWYKWQRSTDGGLTWTDPPVPTSGQARPTWVNGAYQFITNYPPFMAYTSDSGHLYRVIVATTSENLTSLECYFYDENTVRLQLIDCSKIVDANILSFSAQLQSDDIATLNWKVSTEVNMVRYEIEKSEDGNHFTKIGEVIARNTNALLEYYFTDPAPLTRNTYYRLKLINSDGSFSYSRVILLNKDRIFQVNSLLNPFKSTIVADLFMPEGGLVKMRLYDNLGKLIGHENRVLFKGLNNVSFSGWDRLSSGMYIISFENNGQFIQRKVTKIP